MYFQDQTKVGGSCLKSDQCTNECDEVGCTARLCLPDTSLPAGLKWTNQLACRLMPNPALPLEIIILFFLTALVIIASIIFTCCTCYYVGSKNPKLRKAVSVRVNQNSQNQLTIPNALGSLDHSGQTDPRWFDD